jgi:endonuclease/exonuclease/phosphatase family metal-dependent hydrolase
MATVVASFNVENLFSRPKAFTTGEWAAGEPVLEAYQEFTTLISRPVYRPADRDRMRQLLVELDVYRINSAGAVRRHQSDSPRWAWLRKNRGTFDREPGDPTKSVEITATGRGSWIGWLELATETTDETGVRTTARVIGDIDADILAVVEVEDRPALVRFNRDLLGGRYEHVMLVDGNDERGIDVGILTKPGYPIRSIRSHVDARDDQGIIFSRDCPVYEVGTPDGTVVHVLVNHFKSQSGGGGPKRLRQAREVHRIADGLTSAAQHVIVLGDLNEGPPNEQEPAVNLQPLFDPAGPLVSCNALDGFDVGNRPGTFDSCGIRNRLDYLLLSHSLQPAFRGGQVFRRGLWGSRTTRPDAWDTYPEMTTAEHQASDHAALVARLDI